MTVIDGVWYDNKLGRIKDYDGVGSDYVPSHIHKFEMGKNSAGIPIIVCKSCKFARMYIMLLQKDRREDEEV